jgi:cytochrome c biogenesis protein CcmG/thiol:disulfide interchange protein DsbE
MSRAVRFTPLVLLGLLFAGLIWRLATPLDTVVKSKLGGKPVPAFVLPAMLDGKPALASSDLATGEPHLVNLFASWCVPCIGEAPVLAELKSKGVKIEGIAVRDRPQDISEFFGRYGDPYERIGSDDQSAVQIAMGSSGVPESFVIDGRGVVLYQHVGPIEPKDVPKILDKLEEAKR